MTAHVMESPLDLTHPATRGRVMTALAIAFGVGLTLCMQGYQFGKSNHTVYLVDALRHAHPELLQNDWFATQTLQYHAAFGWMTRLFMQFDILTPAFLVGYLALAVLLHVAWWRIVKVLGGGLAMFLVSETLYHLSAGGTGLGMYQFLQDGAFLPSNIAAVAMLWGLCLWLEDRRILAGLCFGLAGMFHLNFALVGMLVWTLLNVCEFHKKPECRSIGKIFWISGLLAIMPSILNIGFALRAMAGRQSLMPLAEFVELYVQLRHPHHYDPSSWPPGLWIAFLWPIPLAVMMYERLRRRNALTYAWQESAKAFFIFSLLLIVALIGAGLTYTSEQLIQASLYRFSVYPKLLSCIAASMLITEFAAARRRSGLLALGATAGGVAIMVICLIRGPYLGLFSIKEDAPAYLAACDSIRRLTPVDAVFLVPPDEQSFRIRAQRAIVVNFKGVPQLSSELRPWRDRLQDVLDIPDLRELPRSFDKTLAAMRDRYESLPPEYLASIAHKYPGTRYILVGHRFPAEWEAKRVDLDGNTSFFLYDLSR